MVLIISFLYIGCESESQFLQQEIHTQGAQIEAQACSPHAISVHRSTISPYTTVQQAIYGGIDPVKEDPIIASTLALFRQGDADYDFALVDGSATLISPTVALGAAHTCEKFKPLFATIGPDLPYDYPVSFEEQLQQNPKGSMAQIVSCVMHPKYEEGAHQPHDIALFYLSHQPEGSQVASIIAPDSILPSQVTIAGFGARSGQFDMWWEEIEAYRLQRVDTRISTIFEDRFLFMDGPNYGKGSCQGDSGGPIYKRIPREWNDQNQVDHEDVESQARNAIEPLMPLVIGSVVMGPACEEGIGYNTDLRHYIEWIANQPQVELKTYTLTSNMLDEKEDQSNRPILCK